ncbi:MAG: MFS transporter [Spirochaetaceae bacterium]|nr:MFS transporter [Myxococcales bacterium]MCB9724692.1 MFS transporter [Spirochaetaceae bacterium]HPG25152.1 MFS transporter [Myxococcota bacterium]
MATGTSGVLAESGLSRATTVRFLGWRMLALTFVANFLASAISLSAFGNFIDPLAREFGVARSTIGYGLPCAILTMGIAGPFVGRWLDQGRARRMMSAGAALAGFGLLLASRAPSIGLLAAAFVAFVCTGAALFGIIPSMAVVASWFVRRRGLAIGVTVAGATVASYVAPASAQWLIDAWGWRTAFVCFGATGLFLAAPLFAFCLVGRPEEVGQRPDGGPTAGDPSSGSAAYEDLEIGALETSELVRDRRLWLLAIGFGLVSSSPVVLLGLLVPYGTDLGFTQQQANVFFLTMMPLSLAAKVVIGGLADRAPLKPAMLFVVVLNVLVWVVLATEPGYPLFLAAGALYGIGIGGAAPLQGVAIGRVFGRANFGRANGMGGLVGVPIIAIASATSHFLLGATGGYGAGFALQMGLIVLGGAALAVVRIPTQGAGARVPPDPAS